MPGVDFKGQAMIGESPVLGSLKAHKVLPRNVTMAKEIAAMPQEQPNLSPPAPLKARDKASYPPSGPLRLWMQDFSDTHAVPVVSQPLTPPINFRDNFKSWIDDKALRDREFMSQQKIDPGNTPLVANSPPTPESTPPRQTDGSSKADPSLALRNVPDRSAGASRNAPESRTDSFRTARENLSSDDESHPPDSPSLHPSRQKWLRDVRLTQSTNVGLGLELESEDDEPPTPREPERAEAGGRDLVTFDGVWNSKTRQVVKRTESQVTKQADPSEKNRQKLPETVGEAQVDSPTLGVEARTLSRKKPRPRRKPEKRGQSTSAERKPKTREQGQTPRSSNDDSHIFDDLDGETHEVNGKRLSQASTTSTIVEAMVIEPSTPAHRRQTLRHTGKMMRLDALRNPQLHSTRTSSHPDDHALKHQLRSAKNVDQGLRERFASETFLSGASKSALAKLEGSEVVVIPDRRSSLQSSADSTRRLSRTFSLNSKQQSSRPTTAPEDSVGYFDVPRRERRTVSVVIQQATPLKMEKKLEKEHSPLTHPEVSPAAAEASRELSRTTSVTSGGLATHYIPQTPTSQGTTTPQTADANDNQPLKADRSNSGDWTTLRPNSALVTPYSLRSAQSSTPGTLEVNEATAISIYPHTNKSILVIQETSGGDDSSTKEQSAMIAGNASIALPYAFAPVISQPAPPSPQREIRDSPLQNPREPPQPPDFKIIPPTPANAASSSEDTVRNVSSSQRSNRFGAPFASLKRALSSRRYSESISNPFIFTRTLSLRDATGYRRPRTAEDNRDSQLHPFWRPRTIWDGNSGSDTDSDFGNNGTLSPRRPSSHGTTHKTSNPPKRTISLTRRFAGSLRSESTRRPVPRRASISLTGDIVSNNTVDEFADVETKDSSPKRTLSLTRKIGGSLRLPYTSTVRHRRPQRSSTADWHNQPNYEFIPAVDRQYLAEESLQPRNIGFQTLAERIERRRSLREESKREERRNWLKGRIGFVGVRDLDVPAGFDMVYPPPRPPTERAPAWRISSVADD